MADNDWHDGNPKALLTVVKKLEGALASQRLLDGVCTRMFYGESILPTGTTATTSTVPRASSVLSALEGTVNENLVKQVIEAQASMVVRKPAFKVVTTGSSWAKQVAARRASRLLSGVFSSSGLEAATPAIYRDSKRCIVAAARWSIDEAGAVRCARALPHTISFNPAAGPNPREIYQRHGVPRSTIKRRYPEVDVDKLPAYKPSAAFHAAGTTAYYFDADLAEVVEAWRKPEGKDPGRYVMVSGDQVLEDELWDLPIWPLVVLTDGDSYDSLAGTPLARDVLPYQRKVNRMNRQIEENAAKCANPRIAMPKGSEVSAPLTSTMAEVVLYNAAGGQVSWLPGMLLPPQFYAEKQATKDAAFEQAGVSRSVATATKTPGLNSGRAQRDEYDRASGRLILDAERLERWYEANAMTALALMRQAYKKKSKRIQAPNTRLLEEIDWTEVGDLKEDEIQVRAYVTSAIPLSPAGRAETIAERVEAGVMSEARAARWYADPDTARLEDQDSAAEDFALRCVDSALIEGVYIAPIPELGQEGLAMLVGLATRELLRALTLPEPPPDAHLELLRRLIAEAQLLAKPPQAAAQPDVPTPAPAGQVGLGAVPSPEATPVS